MAVIRPVNSIPATVHEVQKPKGVTVLSVKYRLSVEWTVKLLQFHPIVLQSALNYMIHLKYHSQKRNISTSTTSGWGQVHRQTSASIPGRIDSSPQPAK